MMRELRKPVSFDRLLYADADPVNLWDPNGKQEAVEYSLLAKSAYERVKLIRETTKTQNDVAYANLQVVTAIAAPAGVVLGETNPQKALIPVCYAFAVAIGKQIDARSALFVGGTAATFIYLACVIGGGLTLADIDLLSR